MTNDTVSGQLREFRQVRTPRGEAFFKKPIGTPLSEAAYAEQLALDRASRTSLDRHMTNGVLSKTREALHEKLIDRELGSHTPVTHPVATFLGGGPASGKTSVMRTVEPNTVHVAGDDLQEEFPDYQRRVNEGDIESAAWAHDEASLLANKLMNRAMERRHNFVLDGTGDSTYAKLERKVKRTRDSGYLTSAKYVTVNTDEAVQRAKKRAEETGRMVPESAIRKKHADVSDTFKRAMDNDLFDSAELWDNNGSSPRLVASKPLGGTFQVHDPDAWQQFLDKRNEAELCVTFQRYLRKPR